MQRPSSPRFALLVTVVVGLTTLCVVTHAADSYALIMQRAAKLKAAGQVAAAIDVLRAAESRYAQDYALQLQLGWLHFLAGSYEAAERHYRLALALAPGSRDARHGLAWTLLRLDRQQPAREAFQKVLQRWPDTPLARRGLALIEARQRRQPLLVLSPSVYSTAQLYQTHPSKKAAVDLSLDLPLRLYTHWCFDLSYRYSYFWLEDNLLPRPPWIAPRRSTFDQHALFLSAGAAFVSWGLTGHYAYIHDGSGFFDYTFLAGLSARYSPLGDLLLHANVGFYSDLTVYNIVPAWRVSPWRWLAVTPSARIQRAVANTAAPSLQLGGRTAKTTLSASATVELSGSRGRLYLGGRLGSAIRPASLDLHLIANHTDRVSYGAWAGGQLRLPGGWSLQVAYELTRLQTALDPLRSVASNLHLMTLGACWTNQRK